jgi:L-fuculose-phosphate aldolase
VNPESGLRLRVATIARQLAATGMNPGRSGNLSARVDGGFVITPTGAPYDTLHPDDLVFIDDTGAFGGGQRKPSSEWRLHFDIYRQRPEARGIVHSHSPYATTLACLRRGIPAFHYEIAFAGGNDIRCARYATFGTQALSDAALAALEGRHACLLANHGAVAFGESIEAARELAEKVDALARPYWQALQVGEPTLLDEAEMARIAEKFTTYGRQ